MRASYSAPAAPKVRPEDHLSLSFFQRLLTPDDNEGLVDGCRELALGNEDKALEHLRQAVHLAGGVYLAGFLDSRRSGLRKLRTIWPLLPRSTAA